jgi:phosphatidate cytidylyltransferase
MGNFIKRVISALIMLPPVIYVLYKGSIFLMTLVTLVVILCSIEYYRMAGFGRRDSIVAIILHLGAYLTIVYGVSEQMLWVSVVLIFSGLYVLFTVKDVKGASYRAGYLFMGVLYLGVFPAFIYLLREYDSTNGFYYIFTYLATIWLSDTFAYFTGKSIGRHKLYEMISPKKTIEGSIGGLAGGIIGIYAVALIFGKTPSISMLLFVGIVVNAFGQMGDLFESMLKRDYGIKDSGDLIPGHGGMLDRVDAIILSAPIMYLYIRFLI